MNRRTCVLAAAFLIMSLALSAPGIAGENKDEKKPEMTPEMEAWMKLAAPGEHHKHLGHLVGAWTYESTHWEAPGKPPTKSMGTADSTWILGGRFVQSIMRGDYGGMPFEGRSLEGFDNQSGRYRSTWADNFGTMTMQFDGECEKDGKVRTMISSFKDPSSGQMVKYRAVTTVIDKDHYKYEAYMVSPEGEFKNMELTASRK
jgi:hypothetical protein